MDDALFTSNSSFSLFVAFSHSPSLSVSLFQFLSLVSVSLFLFVSLGLSLIACMVLDDSSSVSGSLTALPALQLVSTSQDSSVAVWNFYWASDKASGGR